MNQEHFQFHIYYYSGDRINTNLSGAVYDWTWTLEEWMENLDSYTKMDHDIWVYKNLQIFKT